MATPTALTRSTATLSNRRHPWLSQAVLLLMPLMILPSCDSESGGGSPEPRAVRVTVDRAASAAAVADAVLLLRRQQGTAAQERLLEATRLDANSAEAFYWLGRAYMIRGASLSPSRAIEAFRESQAIEPSRSDLDWGIGLAFYHIAEYEQAEQHLTAYLDSTAQPGQEPQRAEAEHTCGVIALNDNRPDSAVAHLQRAFQLRAASAETAYYLGLAHQRLDQIDKAIESLEQAIALDPGHGSSFHQLGRLYARTNNPEKARRAQEIHRLLNELTDNISLRVKRDTERTLGLLEQLTALQPENHRARVQHASLLRQRGQEIMATLILDGLLSDVTQQWSAYVMRAELAWKVGNKELAAQTLKTLLERNPKFDPAQLPAALQPLVKRS